MRPTYLLLLLMMACGFFACTTDLAQEATEITPAASEGKILDAYVFADFMELLVEFDLFNKDELLERDYGASDYRLSLDSEEEFNFKPLTEEYFYSSEYPDPLAELPARHWASSITLGFTPDSAGRLNNWLSNNFSGQSSIDLRIALLENGTILFQGIPTSSEAVVDFPEINWSLAALATSN